MTLVPFGVHLVVVDWEKTPSGGLHLCHLEDIGHVHAMLA